MILILGGTAAYFLDLQDEFGPLQRVDMDTPYGTAFPLFVSQHTPSLVFASRHGIERLEVTPPFVNARANIWAAHALGVQNILSWNGVGAINPLLELHDILVLDGVLDCTRGRVRSFHEQGAGNMPTTSGFRSKMDLDLDIESPFDERLRTTLYAAARKTTERVFGGGIYACSEGPRLETAAEIQLFKHLGADVVGMTLVPEVFLANELGMGYASLAYVTNYATGLEPVSSVPRHFGVDVARCCLGIVRAAMFLDTPSRLSDDVLK
jgi:5'-methylthioadenosine phosphorylase